ncbi:putative RNA-directed DNA polymerase, eukaryota, reverse transcriptase zinc-binding domain protein [Tanacetum coccineum]
MCRSEGFLDVQFKYLGGLWVLFEFLSHNAKDNFIKHEGILSRFSSLKPWHDDFVVKERLIWLEIEGVPLRAWNKETFTYICSKWGEVLFSDDTDECNRLSKWLCIKSSYASLVFATIMIPLNKVTYAIRVRELCSWTPSFLGEDSVTDDEDFMGKYEADKANFFENKDVESAVGLANDIGDENIYINNDQVHNECAHEVPVTTHKYGSNGTDEEPLDSDPFKLDSLIKKRGGKDTKEKCSVTPDFLPGFSPNSHKNQKGSVSCNKQEDDVSREHLRFSLVEHLEETIKVGLALGLNMEGCENTLASLIVGNGEIIETKVLHVDLWMLRQVWGNSHFDFASISTRGMSGLWFPNDVRLMWIIVYAPQNLPIREAGERYRLIFNEMQAEIFNEFISNSALIDILLGGFSFTWIDKWGSNMSKLDQFLVSNSFYEVFSHVSGVILEKGIPDHSPILLKEFVADCGPTPF